MTEKSEIFQVPRHIIAPQSIIIATQIKELGLDKKNAPKNPEPIPLPDIAGDIFQKVLDWCTYHVGEPIPAKHDYKPMVLGEWDTEYVQSVEQGILFAIILAANSLEIQGLLNVCCKGVAMIAEGKSVEELRETFNIKNDFTPEEEEEIRRDNEERLSRRAEDPFLRQGTSGS